MLHLVFFVTFTAFSACYVVASHGIPVTRTGPDIVGRYGAWNYRGCYVDNPERILSVQQDLSGKTTVEACLDICAKHGYPMAGVEFADQCFCGTALAPQATLASDQGHACDMPCTANPRQVCGGTYAINVYEHAEAVTTYGSWTLVGCAVEPRWHGGRPRNLPFHPNQEIPFSEMTVERCLIGCQTSGYTCAGLGYGQECWCGNCQPSSFNYGLFDQCYLGCAGNTRELCGSGEGESWKMIYTLGELHTGGDAGHSGWSGCGCYEKPRLEGVLYDLLPVEVVLGHELTIESCQARCLAAGHHGCSIEEGYICRCTPSADRLLEGLSGWLRLPGWRCNAQCPGNTGETCGGSGLLQAYTYDLIR